jgi:hypothetical protein
MSSCSPGGPNAPHPVEGATKPLTVTVATTRKISGLGNTTIWGLIKNGTLKTIRIGRRRLILYSSLETLLSPTPPEPALKPRRGRPRKVTASESRL